jgi:hypothetical protein
LRRKKEVRHLTTESSNVYVKSKTQLKHTDFECFSAKSALIYSKNWFSAVDLFNLTLYSGKETTD